MKVRVVLFGLHARLLPPGTRGNAASFDVEEGTTLAGLLDAIGVPADGRSYVQLNGARQELAAEVSDGDEVRVIVPLGGG